MVKTEEGTSGQGMEGDQRGQSSKGFISIGLRIHGKAGTLFFFDSSVVHWGNLKPCKGFRTGKDCKIRIFWPGAVTARLEIKIE